MIGVLVVDDSGFMRIALRQMIEAEGDMRVVGEARNGREAVALARELKPDLVTMDIEMPEMDGLEATREILRQVDPAPRVVVVSAHTQAGADATIAALKIGAVDYISKSSSFVKTDLGQLDNELRPKLRIWARYKGKLGRPASEMKPLPKAPEPWSGESKPPESRFAEARQVELKGSESILAPAIASGLPVSRRLENLDLLVVAVSTGGPQTLPVLLRAIGRIDPPIVVAQHMPELFTASFAQHLRQEIGLDVREGAHRMALEASSVTILPGGQDGVIAPSRAGGYELRLSRSAAVVHPCADMLFQSAAMVARSPVAVILTGMGSDGTLGAAHFARRKLPVLVQQPETCIIGGMPSAAIGAGYATESLTLQQIGARILRWTASPRPEST